MRRVFLFVALLTPSVFAQRQPEQSLVLTDSRALMVLEPHMAVAQNVISFSTSPSGRYLVAVQEVPSERPLEIGKPQPEPKAKKIVVWDCTTGVSREIALPIEISADRATISWFAGTDKALVSIPNDRVATTVPGGASAPLEHYYGRATEWHILDAQSATMRKAFSDGGEVGVTAIFYVSPTEPFAMKVQISQTRPRVGDPYVRPRFSVQRLAMDGRWGTETQLSETYLSWSKAGWTPDGRTFQMEMTKQPAGGGKSVECVVKLDPMTGNFTDVIGPVPSYEPKAKERDVSVTYVITPLGTPNEKRVVATWWLKSTTETKLPQTVVAEHAMMAELPLGERFVAYLVNGTLFTRQIIQLTLEQYEQMASAASRAVLVSNAKQVALAALMYATDYDDVLPPDLDREKLGPYAKNDKLFDGFVFVFAGGDLTKVADPANTVLGYIDGPGGRAVAYLDGHVKWEPGT